MLISESAEKSRKQDKTHTFEAIKKTDSKATPKKVAAEDDEQDEEEAPDPGVQNAFDI
jgi:hypothetical protein